MANYPRDPNVNADDHQFWEGLPNAPYVQPPQHWDGAPPTGLRVNLPNPMTMAGVSGGVTTPSGSGGSTPSPGLNKAAQTTLKGFSPSGAPGIFKAIGPDGSVTYTDRPGGTWAQSGDLQHTPGVREYVNNALTPPGVQTPIGEMGTGTGNFSAASIAGNKPGFRYQPPDPSATPSRGDLAGLTPGTAAWVSANNAPMNPLESPEAAAQYAADQFHTNQARRGDGRFNTTVFDPSGYRQAQAATAISPFGMGGAGGMNPIEAMTAIGNMGARQTEAAAAASRADVQNNKAEEDALTNMVADPNTQKEANSYGLDPRTYSQLLRFSTEHSTKDPLAINSKQGANFRKLMSQLTTNSINSGRGPLDWMSGAGPEALPGGDASEGQLEAGKHGELPLLAFRPTTRWNTNAVEMAPQKNGVRIPFDDPNAAKASNNYSYEHNYTDPLAGNNALLARLLRHPTIGPVLQKIAAHDVPIYNRQLRSQRKDSQ